MDYCDMAETAAAFDLELALQAQRRRAAAAVNTAARTDCLVCHEELPLVRQQHGFCRCVECQTRLEARR